MRVWRIERAEHVDDSLSGAGARLFGGRWNSLGTSVVYTSTSVSLAALERFVHAPRIDRTKLFFAVAFDLSKALTESMDSPDPLPANWRSPEPSVDSQHWGDEWVRIGKGGAAAVPSALLPLDMFNPRQEFNVLLNSEIDEIKALRPVAKLAYSFDARMWK